MNKLQGKQNKNNICYQKTYLNSYPIAMQISPTERCNLECFHCYRKKWKDTLLKEDMRLDILDLESVNTVARACEEAWIVSGGEPLLYAGFRDLLDFFRENKVSNIYTITNGTLLTDEIIRFLIESKLTYIKISVDGAEEETCDRIRGRGVFVTLEHKLSKLTQYKRMMNAQYPKIIITFVVMKINFREMPRMIEYGKKWNVERVEFHYCQPDNEEVVELCMYDELEEYNKVLADTIEKANELGVSILLPDSECKKELTSTKLQPGKCCHDPWEFFLIDQLGNVFPCCHLWGNSMGNVYQHSFEQIWNGKDWVDMRKQIIEKGVADCCLHSNCPKILRFKRVNG